MPELISIKYWSPALPYADVQGIRFNLSLVVVFFIESTLIHGIYHKFMSIIQHFIFLSFFMPDKTLCALTVHRSVSVYAWYTLILDIVS